MPRARKKQKTDSNIEGVSSTKPKPLPVSPAINTPSTAPLCAAHQSLLDNLKETYDILPTFTISSTQISKRATRLLEHLRKENGDPRASVAFLHARPADVCKMITIVEIVKRELSGKKEGKGSGTWFQYNMMYELPPKSKEQDTVNETVLPDEARAEDESDDDDFEVMEGRSRIERAVVPEPMQRVAMSLSIFLSRVAVPELKARGSVTMQTNEAQAS